MHLGKRLLIVAFAALATSRASAVAPDDTSYPDVPSTVDGALVIDHEDIVSPDGVVYPGPHVAYLKRWPQKTGSALALSDDTTYPTADPVRAPMQERAPNEEKFAACTCDHGPHGI